MEGAGGVTEEVGMAAGKFNEAAEQGALAGQAAERAAAIAQLIATKSMRLLLTTSAMGEGAAAMTRELQAAFAAHTTGVSFVEQAVGKASTSRTREYTQGDKLLDEARELGRNYDAVGEGSVLNVAAEETKFIGHMGDVFASLEQDAGTTAERLSSTSGLLGAVAASEQALAEQAVRYADNIS